ncbi:pyridoxine 5'-phosphate synthase [Neokomagataea thailandica]|uniref:Pyridoxine 5'-phosphate synthase n=1 Tax=Neokomagataea tanensis NBRC 106556 TaxID=1223519 RepID=A0ABQ0QK04_9PROT|nr:MULTISPECIES: pyridoxine 5'-phosphate synthase [Neokomagataea]GBR47441.1 pyridoxine 5'-phosphate synthase [Neokomagataea tanensis NBRC 106556]
MIRLGVNVDHVATIRNARGGEHPDPVCAAQTALQHGADGITAHLREDRRHIKDSDMTRLRALPAPLNFEMAATEEMITLACALQPHACCLVPEKREEVTTEGGLNVVDQISALSPLVMRLKDAGIRVSLFIDPDARQIQAASQLGVPVVELHTGAYAHGGVGELERLFKAADIVKECGIELHAGHGLTYSNVLPIRNLPGLKELNIGHFLIGQSVFEGLGGAVQHMKTLINSGPTP